jgi:lipopolysaccharide cholinephosphotransferase
MIVEETHGTVFADSLGKETSIKDVQRRICQIYQVFQDICERHSLRYFAIGGTCIGAVRHGGFIPWDDDMDIAMPDEDYARFQKIADKELPDGYELYRSPEHDHVSSLFLKIHDVKTTFVEKSGLKEKEAYKGVFLDIMPLCGLPADIHKRKKQALRIMFTASLNRQRHQDYRQAVRVPAKLIWLASRPFDRLIPLDYWAKRWEKLYSRYKFDESPYVGFAWSSKLYDTRIFRKEIFDAAVDFPFENTTVPCPVGYDRMLRQVYDDYMQLPPENERIHHGWGILDLDRSFREYL